MEICWSFTEALEYEGVEACVEKTNIMPAEDVCKMCTCEASSVGTRGYRKTGEGEDGEEGSEEKSMKGRGRGTGSEEGRTLERMTRKIKKTRK